MELLLKIILQYPNVGRVRIYILLMANNANIPTIHAYNL